MPELSLLRRELTELANRRRTYVVRVVGAFVVLFFVYAAYKQAMSMRLNQPAFIGYGISQYFGIGRRIFAEITTILFYAIQLLMPALCCACITTEKESNTIGTLLLTRLSPATIIAEKFLSRLVPMLTLLLLTFPVLAHVLTLGGVDTDLMIGTLWLLFCECLLFASIALLCSAWFATTVSAFTMSYCITGFLAILSMSLEIRTFVPSAIWRSFYVYGTAQVYPNPLANLIIRILTFDMNDAAPLWLRIFVKSIPSLMVTAGCLLAARLMLFRRAFPSHSSALLKFFRHLDTFFQKLNDRTTGGIVLIKDTTPMPGNHPVVWREQYKKSLGNARYLFRILIVLEGPTLFICMMAATLSAHGAFDGLYALQAFIWILAILIAAVKAATLFSSERSQQTIEPLLATPMGSVDMLNQKVTGMNRLLIVLAVPILTVNLTHFILNSQSISDLSVRSMIYIVFSLLNTWVLLRLVTWVSAGIGLKIHSQTRAVLAAVGVIGLWIAIPLAVLYSTRLDYAISQTIFTFTPISPVAFTESYLREEYHVVYSNRSRIAPNYLVWATISVTIYSAISLIVPVLIRRMSPRLLGRREIDAVTRTDIDRTPITGGVHP